MKTKANWTNELKEEVKKVEELTYDLLSELGVGSHKTISKIYFLDLQGSKATWWNREVRIWLGCDPWAIAHEIGHGVHELYRAMECVREKDTCGESWAEAIRYFIEERHNPDSEWLKNAEWLKGDVILKECNCDWNKFKEMFSNRKLTP